MSNVKRRRSRAVREGDNPARVMMRRYERLADRAGKYTARIKAYQLPDPKIAETAEGAIACIRRVVEALEKVPADWRPARGTVSGTVIAEGAIVRLNEQGKKRHADLFDASTKFRVVKVSGSRILCVATETVSQDGDLMNMVMPLLRSHVRLA